MTNKIKQIQDFGQRIWLDFFDRAVLNSGYDEIIAAIKKKKAEQKV